MIQAFLHKIRKHPIQFFIAKLLVLFVIIFILDQSIGYTLRYFYFKQQSGFQYRTTYSIEKTNAELLVFGSSRANHHYPPDIFENKLNMSFYNVGRDGNSIFYHSALLRAVLKRYTPKMIILDFDPYEFSLDQGSYDRLSALLPYYKTHPEMRSIIEMKSPYEKIKLLSATYPFNSGIFSIAAGNTDFNKKRMGDNKGYVALSKIWNQPLQIDSNAFKFETDSNKIKLYEEFIKECINAKIKLYIACSPFLLKSGFKAPFITIGEDIAARYDIPFLDYSMNPVFVDNVKIFEDLEHLNDTGARLYCHMLLDSIRKLPVN